MRSASGSDSARPPNCAGIHKRKNPSRSSGAEICGGSRASRSASPQCGANSTARRSNLARSCAAVSGEDMRDGLREILEILGAQAGDIDAAVVGHVDMALGADPQHLLDVETQEREHALLLRDESEVA